ncbi:MAG TPA: hypothetical protein VHM88_00565 [Candidatus Acidoferrales bacterium]|nr:hypothetical protein [Candidatus Acidoferrales bacterium]
MLACFVLPLAVRTQEKPYFVSYDHHMEEPGSLEISVNSVGGSPQGGHGFAGAALELGYGVKGWWTTEVYLDAQSTRRESTVLTGWKWENRFRPLLREHWINPVVYVEFVHVNGADKAIKEVVGFDSERDFTVPNGIARREHKHEIETKLILSSDFRGWNICENFIAEKNLSNRPWEFGYALGVNRPLRLAASAEDCSLCRENFRVGVEAYGGLGEAHKFLSSGTSHYLAPLVSWELPSGATLRFSPGFGLTRNSHRVLLRFGVTYEMGAFGRRLRRLFR